MATRMLILDYALVPPVVNEGIAFYYSQAGCAVDVRAFYPNLVRGDLAQYDMIALLAGRTPAYPSGMMSVHEVALATEFVRNGGTLILAPNLEGGEGANERHLFNRVLVSLKIAIQIENVQIEDPVNGYAGTLGERPLFCPSSEHPVCDGVAARLAFDRSVALRAGADVGVPLVSFDTAKPHGTMPVVALGRSGKGHVLVAGRHVLNATGVPLRISGEPLVHPEWLEETDIFLQKLADYTVGLTADKVPWSDVNSVPAGNITRDPVDFDLDRSAVLDRLPQGMHVHRFQFASDRVDAHDVVRAGRYDLLPDERLYGWVREEGVRASWGSTVQWGTPLNQWEVRCVTDGLKASDVNLFWGIANCQAVGGVGYTEQEKADVLQCWEWTAAELDGSPVKWYPTLDYRFFREEKTRCYGAQGQKLDAPSPMDRVFWRENWGNSLRAIAEFSLAHPCVGGIAMDVELYAHPPAYNYYMGYGFEDACYFFALENWRGSLDDGVRHEAKGIQLPDRFNWLRRHGLLEGYFNLLSAEVERICREIKTDILRINPDLLFASYIFTTPCNWFDLGVYRGFSSPERPIILMTFNIRSGRMLEYLRHQRVYAYHATVALLGMMGREDYNTVFANASKYGHGYWMNNINALLKAEPESVESPARQGLGVEEALSAIREANAHLRAVR